MVEITEKEYEQFKALVKVWAHARPEESGAYFICGEGGSRDGLGLPEFILVCPIYGADFRETTKYVRHDSI